jgi:ribose transport system substrate-binding protein
MNVARHRLLRHAAAIAATATLAWTITACGESDQDPSADAPPTDQEAETGGDARAVVDVSQDAVARNYEGTDRALPTAGPPAQEGKAVWVIPCGSAAAGCQGPAEGAMAAGEAIGWDMTLADGRLDPEVYNEQIRAAVVADADAIVLVAIDCVLTRAALQEARDQGVEVHGIASLDCDDRYTQGDPLFSAEVQYGEAGDYGDFVFADYSKSMADYVIATSNGNADVIEFREDDILVVRSINDGFDARMSECTTCAVTTVPFTAQDLVQGRLQAKATAALSQNPDADYVMVPYDAAITLGIGAAVAESKNAGRELVLVGGEGLPANVTLLEEGVQDFIAGSPYQWSGWAAIDGLNRVFAGEPQVDSGIGLQSIDRDHPLPDGQAFYDGNHGPDFYEDAYRQLWGLS